MSKPATIAIGTASIIALAVILVFALRDKRPVTAPPQEFDPVAEPTPAEPTVTQLKYVPRLLPSLVAAPALQAPAVPGAGRLLDEESLLTRLHGLAGSDPPLSLKLAREAVARFSDTPNAPEFQWNVVKALHNMGRGEDAMNEARIMVEKYPGNSFTGDIERHLLHPQPNQSESSNP